MEDNIFDFFNLVSILAHLILSEKLSTLKKMKEFAPLGNKFVPFKVDTFFRRQTKTIMTRVTSPAKVSTACRVNQVLPTLFIITATSKDKSIFKDM